jgi:hypothetical protein
MGLGIGVVFGIGFERCRVRGKFLFISSGLYLHVGCLLLYWGSEGVFVGLGCRKVRRLCFISI